jgi:hypothetical protein
MQTKAKWNDFPGRFREIIGDPLNLLIRRDPMAGMLEDDCVVLHNGHRVPVKGPGAYYDGFSDVLVMNRGVHEPVEEFAFQQMLPHLPDAPVMLELGAYWAHYSMWIKQSRPQARCFMVEPDTGNLAAGQANFARHGYDGTFVQAMVGPAAFTVDGFLVEQGLPGLTVLHSDIQGAEVNMLHGAARVLASQAVGYVFVSTHSQTLHGQVCDILQRHGYRIEISSDHDHETTSMDGFVLAVAPSLPPVHSGAAPMGRTAIAAANPAEILAHLRRVAVAVDNG